jgi:hypothetical protein
MILARVDAGDGHSCCGSVHHLVVGVAVYAGLLAHHCTIDLDLAQATGCEPVDGRVEVAVLVELEGADALVVAGAFVDFDHEPVVPERLAPNDGDVAVPLRFIVIDV